MRFEKKKIREWHQIANSNGRKEREKRGEEKRECCLFSSLLVVVCLLRA